MAKTLHAIIFFALISMAGQAFAATHYVAANGSDANNGTSKSTPWQHAPGMPNCVSACASYTPVAGDQIIFRGGDTWHFGNSGATPYTGGTWNWTWSGASSGCDTSDNPSAVRTSCIYVGVDKTWYSGSSWSRPIMTGDNPTSTTPVSSCTYGNVGPKNQFLSIDDRGYAIFDNFEWTGMCQRTASSPSNNYLNAWDLYIDETGATTGQVVQNVYSNNYEHGWTHLPFSCSDSTGEPIGQCFSEAAFGNGGLGSTISQNICDGWDSDPTAVGCILYDPAYLVYDSVFEHMAQIVVNNYHVWHDNLWDYYYPTGDGVAHGNQFESNQDAPGCDSNGNCQPNVPFNVFYNNVMGHNMSGTGGDVKLWFCPNSTAAEYQFNNVVYDQGQGNNWDFATSGFNCTASNAGVYLFNNTIELPLSTNTINCIGKMHATNNHIITESGTGFESGACTASNNTIMSHSTAVAQGYMASGTGMSGNNGNVSCADDNAPCAPTSSSNATVGAAANLQSYCDALLGSSDGTIQRAGQACQSGTTDSCTYNTTSHTVSCPRQAPPARGSSWDIGAYQYNGQSGTGGGGGQTGTSSNCTATEKNADYSPDNGTANTASVTANISAAGDLVAITAWCYSSCTPVSVKLGNQTAVETTIPGNPGPGSPGTGQGYIFYVLSAAAAGTQTLTFTASGSHSDIQTSYIDFGTDPGCSFKHDVDYPVGTGTGGTVNTPVITPNAGDLLFNFVYTSEHIDAVNSPWSCPVYNSPGESQTCEFVNTINTAAYILKAPSTSVASNETLIHSTDSWQSLITSFSMTGTAQTPNPPTSVKASAVAH